MEEGREEAEEVNVFKAGVGKDVDAAEVQSAEGRAALDKLRQILNLIFLLEVAPELKFMHSTEARQFEGVDRRKIRRLEHNHRQCRLRRF